MISPLPKKFDMSGLKRLFAILLATYTECYIDPFGVVYGISQFDYTIARSKIAGSEYEALLPYIKDRYVALPDAYSVIKDLKKTRCEVEYGSDGGILRMVDTADENRIVKLYTTDEVQNFQIIHDNYKEKLPTELYDMTYGSEIVLGHINEDSFIDKEKSNEILEAAIAGRMSSYTCPNVRQTLSIDKTMVPKPQYAELIIPSTIFMTKSFIYWNLRIQYPGLVTDIIIRTINYNQ